MAFPLLGAGGLVGSLLGGFFKYKAGQKQAAAQKAADDERFDREKASWDVGQNQRVGKLNAVQGLLQRGQPFLRSGAGAAAGTGPDYTFDPAVLETMQEKTPYSGSHAVDPGAGLGYGALAGGASGLGSALMSAYAQPGQGGGGAEQLSGLSGLLGGSSDIDPTTGRPRVIGG